VVADHRHLRRHARSAARLHAGPVLHFWSEDRGPALAELEKLTRRSHGPPDERPSVKIESASFSGWVASYPFVLVER
jgi:hypothetical protein